MGHAFGLLGDEYAKSSDVCQSFELTPLFPNFSPIMDAAEDLPWAPWVTLPGPYPNASSDVGADDVGCVIPGPGGGQCLADGQETLCRAQNACKMKSSSLDHFCVVCEDHLIHRLFRHIDLIADPVFGITALRGDSYWLDVGLSI